jgi:glycosyltransferase 2 family protein
MGAIYWGYYSPTYNLLFLMRLWERLVTILSGSQRIIDLKSIRPGLYTAYSRSWLARYIPGRVWTLGGRVFLTSKVGVSPEAVARGMAYEVLLSYSIVAIIGIALILAARVHPLAGLAAFIPGLLVFTISIPVAQRILGPRDNASSQESLWSKACQRAQRFLIGSTPFSLKNSIWAVSTYGIYSSLQLVFIFLIAESFVDLTLTQAFIIAGAWGLSLTLGWLSFLPVGLGIRDLLASGLIAQVLDAPTASLIVAASRIVMVGVDLVFVGVVELLVLGLNIRQTQPQTSV